MEFGYCPACGAIAEIDQRYTLESTDGPVEHVHIRCIDGHAFNMPSFLLGRPA
jgi:hypothetical protein